METYSSSLDRCLAHWKPCVVEKGSHGLCATRKRQHRAPLKRVVSHASDDTGAEAHLVSVGDQQLTDPNRSSRPIRCQDIQKRQLEGRLTDFFGRCARNRWSSPSRSKLLWRGYGGGKCERRRRIGTHGRGCLLDQ